MTVQVWRPENERAGRHFVYTTRYVYFFVQLLDQLDDRANLDMLVRRVRRKVNDYLNFPKLWEDTCATYIKVFKRALALLIIILANIHIVTPPCRQHTGRERRYYFQRGQPR